MTSKGRLALYAFAIFGSQLFIIYSIQNLSLKCYACDKTQVENKQRNAQGTIREGAPMKVKDVGANPVLSPWSEIGGFARNKSLPEIIQVDYTPITINSSMNEYEVQASFIQLTLQRQIICTNWEMYGKKTDGGWPVCKAQPLLPNRPCTVYSFGIDFDFSFDDSYREKHGCTIRSFDPSMKLKEHVHSPSVFFYPYGLWSARTIKRHKDEDWRMDTYRGFLTGFKEENMIIPYLKFDLESAEWVVLEQMFEDNLLSNVMQLSFEVHMADSRRLRKYVQILKKLEELGFRRWYYYHRIGPFLYQADQSFINLRFLENNSI